ncbi:endonuclease/exonuclease/phosphatase family protein [Roseivirga misakiensis]|nr:endonuclease/exonuclease/phosphatase family protein [Roseivirga misakiensis]
MSYNIKHGVGNDAVLDLSRAASVINDQKPDICGLQEIDYLCTRSDSVDQSRYLAERTNMKSTFGKFMDYQGGAYGMATLTTNSVVKSTVLSLPDGLYEPRSAIVQELELAKGGQIVFVNVHFDWIGGDEGSASRLRQAKALVDHLNSLTNPIVITGDFNCTPDSPTMRYFYDHGFQFADKGEDNLSFQGEKKSEIDHVIYRGTSEQKIGLKSIRLLNEPIVSDHRPLVAELQITY